ncbi:DUF6241 domain-containing protein [Gracilibacillus kekensis]|uniref:Uncharacterized protein n=1 Tax=Gracilibacillus kekensis TaxID=1027249 RepID=A0A1M7PYZ7_9BACI|nr:DUF6241 domain-containing protein [Gracilibacillus kekensis]SHN22997.1 hypothetical protein SAMN05216179_2623 [Gracilibacillus kekensis]
MKNKLLGIIGWIVALGLGVAVIGLAIFIIFALVSEDNVDSANQEELVKSERKDSDTVAEKESEQQDQESIQEEVQEVDEEKILSENSFMNTLHKMTHQKIHANEKWGAVEITPERINLMLDIAKDSTFTHREFYMDALTAWKNGDFSNAVEVHNYIWERQNGTIGRASRLLTEEEERQYVEMYFE